jgi:mannose-6-phosphate isomerase-like protein (cupin superfamily)
LVWQTARDVVVDAVEPDPTGGPHRLPPPDGGTVFRITEFPPDTMQSADAARAREIFAAMGGEHTLSPKRQQPHALMHRTRSVDYAIVLEGEIVLVLDDSEVALRAGDVVVQRGTNHAWSNRSGAPCRMAFVLVDAQLAPALASAIAAFDDG